MFPRLKGSRAPEKQSEGSAQVSSTGCLGIQTQSCRWKEPFRERVQIGHSCRRAGNRGRGIQPRSQPPPIPGCLQDPECTVGAFLAAHDPGFSGLLSFFSLVELLGLPSAQSLGTLSTSLPSLAFTSEFYVTLTLQQQHM